MITYDRVRELFDYSDGNLIRKVARGKGTGKWKPGEIIGSSTTGGYLETSVDYRSYKLHRLIWLWHYGYMPTKHLDHIDGNPANNRIENLREVNDSENMQNIKKARANNRVGLAGVYPVNGKFRVQLTTNRQKKHIGYFDTPEEAHAAYIAAKRAMHPFSTL